MSRFEELYNHLSCIEDVTHKLIIISLINEFENNDYEVHEFGSYSTWTKIQFIKSGIIMAVNYFRGVYKTPLIISSRYDSENYQMTENVDVNAIVKRCNEKLSQGKLFNDGLW